MPEIIQTPEIRNVLRRIASDTGHTVVNTYAGGGKSTVERTAIMASDPMVHTQTWVTTHSNHITKETAAKLPPEVYCKGLHSVGLGVLHAFFRPKNPNYVVKEKYEYILRDILKDYVKDQKEHRQWSNALLQMWDLSRSLTIDIANINQIRGIASQYLIECPFSWEQAKTILSAMSDRGRKEGGYRVDFTDMLWLPITMNLPPTRKFIHAYMDEGQDCTPLQAMFYIVYSEGARRHIFGDVYQSIFAFMGASGDILGVLHKILSATPEGCEKMGLTVCWRCPTSHLDIAREIIPDIKNAPGAIVGNVYHKSKRDILTNMLPKSGDAFICRTNQPAMDMCHTLNTKGIIARMPGRDIGKYLTDLFDKVCKTEADFRGAFSTKLDNYVQARVNRYREEEGNDMAIASLQDRADSLRNLYFAADDLGIISRTPFKEYTMSMFIDEEAAPNNTIVKCATLHKYKGCEADRIYILDPDHIRHPKARTAIEKQQEINIDYISRTRSKRDLVYVRDTIEIGGEVV